MLMFGPGFRSGGTDGASQYWTHLKNQKCDSSTSFSLAHSVCFCQMPAVISRPLQWPFFLGLLDGGVHSARLSYSRVLRRRAFTYTRRLIPQLFLNRSNNMPNSKTGCPNREFGMSLQVVTKSSAASKKAAGSRHADTAGFGPACATQINMDNSWDLLA